MRLPKRPFSRISLRTRSEPDASMYASVGVVGPSMKVRCRAAGPSRPRRRRVRGRGPALRRAAARGRAADCSSRQRRHRARRGRGSGAGTSSRRTSLGPWTRICFTALRRGACAPVRGPDRLVARSRPMRGAAYPIGRRGTGGPGGTRGDGAVHRRRTGGRHCDVGGGPALDAGPPRSISADACECRRS